MTYDAHAVLKIAASVLVGLFCLTFIGGDEPQLESDAAIEAVEVTDASLRMRKLHMVRPDLIPYPLAIETVC